MQLCQISYLRICQTVEVMEHFTSRHERQKIHKMTCSVSCSANFLNKVSTNWKHELKTWTNKTWTNPPMISQFLKTWSNKPWHVLHGNCTTSTPGIAPWTWPGAAIAQMPRGNAGPRHVAGPSWGSGRNGSPIDTYRTHIWKGWYWWYWLLKDY